MHDPLQRVDELFRERQDAALKQFGGARAREQKVAADLERVQTLAKDYTEQLADAASDGMTAMRFKQWHHFLDGLAKGERQQADVLSAVEQRTAHAENVWHAARAKANAIATLRERRVEKMRIQENRREQRLSDEFAARTPPRDAS